MPVERYVDIFFTGCIAPSTSMPLLPEAAWVWAAVACVGATVCTGAAVCASVDAAALSVTLTLSLVSE